MRLRTLSNNLNYCYAESNIKLIVGRHKSLSKKTFGRLRGESKLCWQMRL